LFEASVENGNLVVIETKILVSSALELVVKTKGLEVQNRGLATPRLNCHYAQSLVRDVLTLSYAL